MCAWWDEEEKDVVEVCVVVCGRGDGHVRCVRGGMKRRWMW